MERNPKLPVNYFIIVISLFQEYGYYKLTKKPHLFLFIILVENRTP